MAELKDIVKFLNDYLKAEEINDEFCWNGLQVEGKAEVKTAVFAENAEMETFKTAIKKGADLIIVHHGHFWKNANPSLTGWRKERIKLLLDNEVSLYVAHIPLDAHKESGNNAQLLKLLGAEIKQEFGKYGEQTISWIGEFKTAVPAEKIVEKINKELNTKCTALLFGPQKIKTIAVASGGAGYGTFIEAMDKKVDLYLAGNTIEIYTTAKDAKFNAVFAGHYATETLGVRALMKLVAKKFRINPVRDYRRPAKTQRKQISNGVKTFFIDSPTGL